MEALLAASAELDEFFMRHHQRLERATTAELPALQEELTTRPKEILEKYNLTSGDLAQWRNQLESHGDLTTDEIEDPHYTHVVKRLMPRQP